MRGRLCFVIQQAEQHPTPSMPAMAISTLWLDTVYSAEQLVASIRCLCNYHLTIVVKLNREFIICFSLKCTSCTNNCIQFSIALYYTQLYDLSTPITLHDVSALSHIVITFQENASQIAQQSRFQYVACVIMFYVFFISKISSRHHAENKLFTKHHLHLYKESHLSSYFHYIQFAILVHAPQHFVSQYYNGLLIIYSGITCAVLIIPW